MFKFLIAISIIFLCGCGSVTVDTGQPLDLGNHYDEYYDSWGLGFAGEARASVLNACPQDKVARIRNYFSIEDILLTGLFFGVYSPRTTTVTCAKETAHALSAD